MGEGGIVKITFARGHGETHMLVYDEYPVREVSCGPRQALDFLGFWMLSSLPFHGRPGVRRAMSARGRSPHAVTGAKVRGWRPEGAEVEVQTAPEMGKTQAPAPYPKKPNPPALIFG